jgi:hypothetical protein
MFYLIYFDLINFFLECKGVLGLLNIYLDLYDVLDCF